MKKMNLKVYGPACALIILISLSYSACKKGEEDPVISIISRTARVEGEWTVSFAVSTGYSQVPTSAIYVNFSTIYDGETETTTFPGGGSSIETVLNYRYSFYKDGTYKIHVERTPSGSTTTTIIDEEGIWDFLAGIGEIKNKEIIRLIPVKISNIIGNSVSVSTYDTRTGNAKVWQIKSLKNKKMVLTKGDETKGNTGDKDVHSTTMTLIQ